MDCVWPKHDREKGRSYYNMYARERRLLRFYDMYLVIYTISHGSRTELYHTRIVQQIIGHAYSKLQHLNYFGMHQIVAWFGKSLSLMP
eukprot:6459870-Amphidinium_carterae.1